MAIQDILDCISAHADARITEYRKAQQRRISDMREASERKMAGIKQALNVQKQQRREELLRKSEAHALNLKKNSILRKKKGLLDALFEETLTRLASLPEEQVIPLIKECLDRIQKGPGMIRPAPAHVHLMQKLLPSSCTLGEPIDAHGGFVFISPTHEQNFTFDHLLLSALRPSLEIEIAASLFRS